MANIDEINLREQTKGGQPATAVGSGEPGVVSPIGDDVMAYAQSRARRSILDDPSKGANRNADMLSPGQQHGKDIADRLALRERILADERRNVARDTAIGLHYAPDDAVAFGKAAELAVRAGIDLNPSAGRTSIGWNGSRFTLSIMGPTGAHYDPTRPSSPGNNLYGSD
jgi:hypothetical protein